ncbi:hyoscyamine 6-dioxygenase-like [Pyrus ussuriensis x Pyrus communis]|uniref:Hyoscyamine 6-dioxygenase-like n=1 Tax=Pyrus ussuriensis x Pyrus communis TaxID=2448454 RepID=A0A5N5FGI7_9ROSA|nr:hyoscyamine 6-dioxygenase-like [Pyrus ussuriensis x Pyrus communis]
MEKLISSWYNGQTLPESYIFPPDARPGNLTTAHLRDNVPLIDLGGAEGGDQTYINQKILKASQNLGFLGHFLRLQILFLDHRATTASDFQLLCYASSFACLQKTRQTSTLTTRKKSCRLSTSSGYFDLEDVHLWRDYLRHPCHPLEECMQQWPQQPSRYRDLVGTCSAQVRKADMKVLELISEGLGLRTAYVRDELCHNVTLSVNHYPPCLDPSLTLGVPKHCDPNSITILLQEDHVNGLQVFKDGDGSIISNGKLKSAEHQAVTSSSHSRTSAAFFVAPSDDCIVEPAGALISASNPQLYKPFQHKEFFINYVLKQGKTEVLLETFTLQA